MHGARAPLHEYQARAPASPGRAASPAHQGDGARSSRAGALRRLAADHLAGRDGGGAQHLAPAPLEPGDALGGGPAPHHLGGGQRPAQRRRPRPAPRGGTASRRRRRRRPRPRRGAREAVTQLQLARRVESEVRLREQRRGRPVAQLRAAEGAQQGVRRGGLASRALRSSTSPSSAPGAAKRAATSASDASSAGSAHFCTAPSTGRFAFAPIRWCEPSMRPLVAQGVDARAGGARNACAWPTPPERWRRCLPPQHPGTLVPVLAPDEHLCRPLSAPIGLVRST